ncbi:MAG: L,D-transpeptidase family protein [Alphaproteobacteria bacterium]|nr:L,D-transpeptidase family protein [Alphaproteobacteria bacterium]
MKNYRISTCCCKAKGPRAISLIRVRPCAGSRQRGLLTAGDLNIPVALGRGGIRANKREGDGATPKGCFRPRCLWWRSDRSPRPPTLLPTRAIGPRDAWCENPADRRYNRPFQPRPDEPADRLRRADHLYDFLIEIDHNADPVVRWRGSAIFIHLATARLSPTAGCVAMARRAMLRLLPRLGRATRIVIG